LKTVIIIPTFNEKNNIDIVIRKIINLKLNLTILVIDDNSDDGTKKKILLLTKKYKKMNYIFRPHRLGIGSAHKRGFQWAKKKKFNIGITIDADMTHNPLLIKKMLTILKRKKFDIISSSRFLLDGALKNWPITRKSLTKIRYFLVKLVLNTSLDSSGGFRCYNLKNIRTEHLFLAKNNSYFFLIESLYYLEKLKYKIYEIPIILPYRSYGSSKMQIKDIFFSLINLFKLRLSK
jgi:dolichol-phosphate mannosyltransferase